jgi:hypothetical protein
MDDFRMEELPPVDDLPADGRPGGKRGLLPRDEWPPAHVVFRWNWGAFLLFPIWPFFHRAFVLGIVCLVVSFVPVLNIVLAACLARQANFIALTRRPFLSAAEFLGVQRKWARAGSHHVVIPLALYLVPPAIGLLVLLSIRS